MFGAVDKMDTQIGRGVSRGFLLGQARGLVRRRADHLGPLLPPAGWRLCNLGLPRRRRA